MIGIEKALGIFMLRIYPALITIAIELVMGFLLSITAVYLFKLYEPTDKRQSIRKYYKATVIGNWLWTILGQFAILIFAIFFCRSLPRNYENVPPDMEWAYLAPYAITGIILLSIAVTFILNYFIVYRKNIHSKGKRVVTALWMSALMGPLAFITGYWIFPSVVKLVIYLY